MHKNNKFPFYNGCHGNQNTFLGNLFFDYVSTCIDGHFGVLSCFYYHRCYAKYIKTTNFHFITVAMATKIRFLIFDLLIVLELVSTVILVYCMTLFIAWVPCRGPKTTKMAKNISFLVAMVTKINILVRNVDQDTRRVNTRIP